MEIEVHQTKNCNIWLRKDGIIYLEEKECSFETEKTIKEHIRVLTRRSIEKREGLFLKKYIT